MVLMNPDYAYPAYPYQMPVGVPTRNARPQRHEIIHVTGRCGVEALQMAPDSQVLLLDDTAPLVWLCKTDGAGYKTATPFVISAYEEPKPVNLAEINERLARLEELLSDKPNVEPVKSTKRKPDAE